jgi:hypothetical protein
MNSAGVLVMTMSGFMRAIWRMASMRKVSHSV